MMNRLAVLMSVAMLLAVAGCSSTGSKPGDVVVDDQTAGAGMDADAAATGVSGYEDTGMMQLDDPNGVLSQRVIYFAFDSFDVAPEDRDLVDAHAAYLVAHPDTTVHLEGHADERGSREYNIGLGDRRARSIQRLFELQGVSPDQISLVSYGEEKPAVDGHDESAWAMNRRVELVYGAR
jgi:peptidoglycan-associated lipoprotein